MRFRTQGELLKHLWKDENQRVYVSRLITKGKVIKESWWYTLLEEDEKKSDPHPIKDTQSSISELEELRANYEYLHDKFMRMKRWYELVIELTYPYAVKNTKMSKSEYKEQLAEAVREQLSSEFWREE